MAAYFRELTMIKSILAASAALAVTALGANAASAAAWDFRAYAGTNETEDTESASDWTVAAVSEDGPGVVFVCTSGSGMLATIAYEASEDVTAQAIRANGFVNTKAGSVTINGDTIDSDWTIRRRAHTLTTGHMSTIGALLNGVYRGDRIELNFNQMDPMYVTFPEPDEAIGEFIANCPTTNQRS